MWISGNKPAHVTAKSVMVSAKRLIDVAPFLVQQQQNGGNKRAGVADADPPDEVDDGETPSHREFMPQMPTPMMNR